MNIGEKIKQIRIRNSLTQEELANRCELSKGFISQIERDLTSPSIATLFDLLECLGTNIQDFFNEKTPEKIVFEKNDVFEKEHNNLNHIIKWLVPNAQKNTMEPIIIELDDGGKSEEDYPHEGEEFGHVLEGTIYLCIGNKKYKVKKNESFYFKPEEDHYIYNVGRKKAKVLWVSSPPNF